jgi:hypothetical protein
MVVGTIFASRDDMTNPARHEAADIFTLAPLLSTMNTPAASRKRSAVDTMKRRSIGFPSHVLKAASSSRT